MIFLIMSRIVSFRTLRERATLGAYFRYRTDFLDYVKDDIHWFIIYTTQIFLAILCVYLRDGRSSGYYFYIILATKYLFHGFIVYFVFFTKKSLSRKGRRRIIGVAVCI